MTLESLGIVDLRSKLPRGNWIIGRRLATTSITIHYNGPVLALYRQCMPGMLSQLVADANWQMRPGWGGTKDGAPHLMYHFVVDALGGIYQTADLTEILWHCGHQDGNSHGLAVHFPIGGNQDATPRQWARGVELIEALRVAYNIPRLRVVGHLEWKHATACPGRLMPRIAYYRDDDPPIVAPTPTPAGLQRFQVLPNLTAPARIRQAPDTTSPIAGRYKPGTIIYVDPPADPAQAIEVVYHKGESVKGDPRWVHLARVPHEQADLGFLSATLVKLV